MCILRTGFIVLIFGALGNGGEIRKNGSKLYCGKANDELQICVIKTPKSKFYVSLETSQDSYLIPVKYELYSGGGTQMRVYSGRGKVGPQETARVRLVAEFFEISVSPRWAISAELFVNDRLLGRDFHMHFQKQ